MFKGEFNPHTEYIGETMNQDIVRVARKELVKDRGGVVEGASNGLLLTGGTVLGVGALAFILPVITLPMLAVLMVVAGIGMKFIG